MGIEVVGPLEWVVTSKDGLKEGLEAATHPLKSEKKVSKFMYKFYLYFLLANEPCYARQRRKMRKLDLFNSKNQPYLSKN